MNTENPWSNCLISMVVDNLPVHYFRAELLLLSINMFGDIPAENVIVQCVDRVDPSFKRFVQDRGYCLRGIAPYLDGTFCNKLQQLEGLDKTLTSMNGIFLLDIDTVLLSKLDVPTFDKVLGKIVDGLNPSIEILERIFSAAGVTLPDRVPCDWNKGVTLVTNFNGGFIYVPAQLASEVSSRWRSWAEWLFEHPDLFDTPRQRTHIDQVSLALTLAGGDIPFAPLAANFNFPIHSDRTPWTFDPAAPLRILHYHTGLSPFGLIESAPGGIEPVKAAVEQINEAIATVGEFRFFDGFKRSQASRLRPAAGQPHEQLRATLATLNLSQGSRRLILHAGTPKTGTSSLQSFLDKNREALLERGLLYPRTDGTTKMPKHQWLVKCLIAADEENLCTRLQDALTELAPSVHTVFLSTEGLFNHWWDFSAAAKSMLAVLAEWFDVEVWIWFRDPESFASRLYLQALTNPRVGIAQCYGRDLSFGEMLDDPWFVRHLDYLGFVREIQSIFGDSAIRPIDYTGDTIGTCKALLGISDLPDYPIRENMSLGQTGTELIRIINRHDLEGGTKSEAAMLVKKLGVLLGDDAQPFVFSSEDLRRLRNITALGSTVLKAEFGLCWPKARQIEVNNV